MHMTAMVRGEAILVRQFAVVVVDGVDRGLRVASTGDELSIGTNDGNDLRLTDPAVSRHHCALRAAERGLELVDLASRNGTFVGELEVTGCFVASGTRFRIGQTTLAVEILDRELEQPLAPHGQFGRIIGSSPAMRRLYPMLALCGGTTATVMIVGETGTGKELIAEAIHEASDRRAQPFVVIDCSALSHELAESELFGHERGAFTGADTRRIGAFESAHGGTVFLDEIGELSLELQPLLLRALEARTIRRLGSNDQRPVDVRVISASHRDLRSEVNHKRFRADLFYRLNVLHVTVPPLRERAGDIEQLAQRFWRAFRSDAPPRSLLQQLATHSWPGNVRELRNAIERAALVGWTPGTAPAAGAPPLTTYQEARDRAVAAWEREWIEHLLAASGGNLSRASRMARMGRSHLRELARRHGLVAGPAPSEDDADPSEPA